MGFTVMANSNVDRGAPRDLPARRQGVSERSEGCGMAAAGAADPAGVARRATAQDRHAGGDERHFVPAAHRLPVALPAARGLSAALDGLQHLSQVPTRGNMGGDLGRGARGVAGTDGPRGQPVGRRSRQPIAEIGGKGGGKDDAVGYDAGKKVKGRKIHALVDTEGLPMRIIVHPAAIQDRDGAGLVLDKIRRRFPWLELIWADGGYNARQVEAAVAKVPVLRMEIVKRSDDMKGFIVLPRRWVVERTFSWFGRNRRLAKDFENLAETLATFVTLASIQLALRAARQGVGRDGGGLQSMDSRPSPMPGQRRSRVRGRDAHC